MQAAARQVNLHAVFVDGGAGAPHLTDERGQRTGKSDDIGKRLALEHALAEGEEGFRGGIGIKHAIVVAEHEDGMRQGGEQQVMLDMPTRRARPFADQLGVHAAISWAWR
jgi:hypothetical protein